MAKTYMSKDARKVFDKFPIDKQYIFDLEVSLKKAYPKNIIATAKKSGIKAAMAMAKNGVFKNIPIRANIEFNDKERKVYNLISSIFLPATF